MLIARYVEDKSVAEIAKQENLSDMQVIRQLSKARDLARTRLSERLKR
jgi:DNA-directed RNA polymerase specialized sigma subunit